MESDMTQKGMKAYYDRFMAGELHGEEMIRVVTNPKFWDFLASHLSIYFRAFIADDILRHYLDMGTKDAEHVRINEKALERAKEFSDGGCHDTLKAEYARVPAGRKFRFLRDWFCGSGMVEGDDERQAMGVGEGAEKENEESGADGGEVWEWTESDSEADLSEGETVTDEDVAREGDWVSSTWPETGWEWTDSDSEAEREEAEREEAESDEAESEEAESEEAEREEAERENAEREGIESQFC